MIDIDGFLINPTHVISAEIERRHYMNGSTSTLVVRFDNGKEFRREHGWGFDAYATLDKLKGKQP